MRRQFLPTVRVCEAWTAIDGPNGCIEHRGFSLTVSWLGLFTEVTVARRVKP